MSDADSAAPLTLALALALPVLRRTLPEVVAGEENLDRTVRWVHVLDVDPDDLLRGGELVLSTGQGPGADAAGQRRFVRGLHEQGAAGLLIELGMSYRRSLPAALVGEANKLGLPLIATHRPVRFVDVTEAIHGALVDRRLALLRRGQEASSRFTGLVLDGRGITDLLQEAARGVGNPVVLENLASQLVGFATHESSEAELLEAREEDRLARDRGETSERGWLSAEVRSNGRPWGQLVALALDSELGEGDRVVLEQAAVAIALSLMQEHTDEQLRARLRGTLLVDLMQQRLGEAEAARRAIALEFPRRHGALLPASLAWRSDRWAELGETPEAAWGVVMPQLRHAFGSHRPALLGLHAGRLLCVSSGAAAGVSERDLGGLAVELRRPLERRGFGTEDVALAFGAEQRTWTEAGQSLERAVQAAGAARAASPAIWLDASRYSVLDLLYSLRSSTELLTFVREQLGALFEERDQRDRELLHTLEVYLDSGGSKAEAARLLHLERQSLYLRLERIERILEVDLADPDVALGLHLAVRALRLTQALAPEQRHGSPAGG